MVRGIHLGAIMSRSASRTSGRLECWVHLSRNARVPAALFPGEIISPATTGYQNPTDVRIQFVERVIPRCVIPRDAARNSHTKTLQ